MHYVNLVKNNLNGFIKKPKLCFTNLFITQLFLTVLQHQPHHYCDLSSTIVPSFPPTVKPPP